MQGRQESSRAEGEFLVVSNSSVIIALARICRLDLLKKLFGKILVPEAIVLALEHNADLLLVDDRDARNLAKKLGLQVMGTLGVIALAKYKGLISKAKPIIDKLVESGFWISRKLLEEFLRELSEL